PAGCRPGPFRGSEAGDFGPEPPRGWGSRDGVGQSSTVPLSPPSYRSPVIFDFTKLNTVAILPPGLSQYCAESAVNFNTPTAGSSGPSGNHASTIGFQSSSIFWRSSTSPAVPDSDTHALSELSATFTCDSEARSATGEEVFETRNHRSPSNSASCTVSGCDARLPSAFCVVSIANRKSLMRSATFLRSVASAMSLHPSLAIVALHGSADSGGRVMNDAIPGTDPGGGCARPQRGLWQAGRWVNHRVNFCSVDGEQWGRRSVF